MYFVCTYVIKKVVSHPDLSVLSMSVICLKHWVGNGWMEGRAVSISGISFNVYNNNI